MNRAQRRANRVVEPEKKLTILTINKKQLDTYMPHVSDGDVIGIEGKKYLVQVVPEAADVVH